MDLWNKWYLDVIRLTLNLPAQIRTWCDNPFRIYTFITMNKRLGPTNLYGQKHGPFRISGIRNIWVHTASQLSKLIILHCISTTYQFKYNHCCDIPHILRTMALDSTDPSYWPTMYIAIVPRVSGSVSAISSSIIIYLVFQSAARLSTIYHRIMFCMSVSDIILSVGYALTSLPMPAEMPMEEELGIYWPGPRYGNTTTCNMQGFMTTFGATSMLGYIVTLCMCKFRMTLEGFSILYAGSNFLFHISLLISSHRFQFFQITPVWLD